MRMMLAGWCSVFHSLVDLQAAINRYLTEHNQAPKPFVWTAEPEAIIAKITNIP